jgi:two-component system cell cycle sensor histidine kinase/response regulator CckA
MLLTADPETGRPPFAFVGLALASAAIAGWLVAGRGITNDPLRLVLVALLVIVMLLAIIAMIRRTRSASEDRLAQVHEQLRQSDDRLRQAQKMEAIGQLAGGIAHDFNNLVTVIGCSVGLIAEATERHDPRMEDLDQIKDASDRAAALTRQLLAFSRRQLLQPVPLDINAVARDMEKMIQRVIGPHITVHATLDHKLALVMADTSQIEQVLMNLAVNARDAMPSGGALLFATANRTIRMIEPHRFGVIAPGEYVTLTVRDTGQGMPPDVLDHLFEPFFTTKERGKGTGLGLSTVQNIVQHASGHIMVESTLGVGTTFTIFLPRIVKPAGVPTPPSGMRFPPDLALTNRDARSHTVMVVDDEQAILDVAARVLRHAGYRVLTAPNGEDALDTLHRERTIGNHVDVLLTDIMMPAMGGRVLADTIAREFPETQVLCMSGFSRDDLHRQYLIDDTTRLVHKPFEVGDLITAIRETLVAH